MFFFANCSDSEGRKGWRDVKETETDGVKDVARIKVWILPCVVSGGVKAWVSPASGGGRLV